MTRQFCREKQGKNGHIFGKIRYTVNQHGMISGLGQNRFSVVPCFDTRGEDRSCVRQAHLENRPKNLTMSSRWYK